MWQRSQADILLQLSEKNITNYLLLHGSQLQNSRWTCCESSGPATKLTQINMSHSFDLHAKKSDWAVCNLTHRNFNFPSLFCFEGSFSNHFHGLPLAPQLEIVFHVKSSLSSHFMKPLKSIINIQHFSVDRLHAITMFILFWLLFSSLYNAHLHKIWLSTYFPEYKSYFDRKATVRCGCSNMQNLPLHIDS